MRNLIIKFGINYNYPKRRLNQVDVSIYINPNATLYSHTYMSGRCIRLAFLSWLPRLRAAASDNTIRGTQESFDRTTSRNTEMVLTKLVMYS